MNALLIVGSAALCGPVAAALDPVVAARAARIPLGAAEINDAHPAHAVGTLAPARQRGQAIPHRTVVVVLVTMICAGALAAHSGSSWALPAELALLPGAVPLGLGDVEWLLLPRGPVWWTAAATMTAITVGAAATGQWHRLLMAVLAAAVLSGLLAVLSLANPAWMGFGDVRLAVPVGLALAWAQSGRGVFLGFLIANVLAGVTAGILLLTRRTSRSSVLPFGPFLAAGAVVALLAIH